jgi:hypothetical protein
MLDTMREAAFGGADIRADIRAASAANCTTHIPLARGCSLPECWTAQLGRAADRWRGRPTGHGA